MLSLSQPISRRELLIRGLAGGAALWLGPIVDEAQAAALNPAKWKGFNLIEKMDALRESSYQEFDFDFMAHWKFNFVRLPVDYRCWTPAAGSAGALGKREKSLKEIDRAIDWARQRGIHASLCLYKAPGFSQGDPMNFFSFAEGAHYARFADEWKMLAKRYANVPRESLSFNLINEPRHITGGSYCTAILPAIEAIRKVTPGRIISADGIDWGFTPVPELASLGVFQATRGYKPNPLTHYGAEWVAHYQDFRLPTWPLTLPDGQVWDKERLKRETIEPWQALEAEGVKVYVGEFGAYNKTPHKVVLAWMSDQLSLWRQAQWGWALWNLRGDFGVLDSQRVDVKYQIYKGHKLDRRMLDLLLPR